MSYSIDAQNSDCYPGTSLLINKLGIQNQKQLEESETLVTTARSLQFELSPFEEELDFTYYRRLHRFVFESLYDWAGELRPVNLSKLHTRFCPAEDLETLAAACFSRLKHMNYLCNLPRGSFLEELVDLYVSINYLHPFREGNGRVQRLYFRQLAARAG